MALKTRILIVDDNVDLTSIISLILTTEGFSVKVCHTLSDCMKELNDWEPHLLLLDVNVNGEDGRALCSLLKSPENQKRISIFLMSGDETTLEQDNGADACISKPFDSSVLLGHIRHFLQQVSEYP